MIPEVPCRRIARWTSARRTNAPPLPDEIVFSIVQKKVISPNDFASTAQLAATLLAFTARYNQTSRPFNWKFTVADLDQLLHWINARQEPASLPQAA
jgi:hypothetical protein